MEIIVDFNLQKWMILIWKQFENICTSKRDFFEELKNCGFLLAKFENSLEIFAHPKAIFWRMKKLMIFICKIDDLNFYISLKIFAHLKVIFTKTETEMNDILFVFRR